MMLYENIAAQCCAIIAFVNNALGQLTINNNTVPFTFDCVLTPSSREYVGTLNVTETGLSCQPWSSDIPHQQYYKEGSSAEFPGDGSASLAGNKCRQPDRSWTGRPWCYTESPSVRWQSCNIPMCECKMNWDTHGSNYLGVMSSTRTGKLCQRWNSSSPHQHPFNNSTFFRDASVASALNYCRNPNMTRPDGPWCYTTDPNVEWEYCFVPVCDLAVIDTSTAITTRSTTVTPRQSTQSTPVAPSTVRTTRTTRKTTRPPTTTVTAVGPEGNPSPTDSGSGDGVSPSVLVPAVISPILIIILLVVMVIIYVRRGGSLPCDVITTLPWNRTNVSSERLGVENAFATGPGGDVTLAEASKPTPIQIPGFDNPIYDRPVGISLKPSTNVGQDVKISHDAECQYADMSQIQLT